MREFTAIITKSDNCYAAVCPELGIEPVSGRSVEEARDKLISAMQHHIDEVCESMSTTSFQPLDPERVADYLAQGRSDAGVMLKVPEYLLTRN